MSLEKLPIRLKLNFLAVFTAGLALSVASWALRFSARTQFEANLKRELQSYAEIIGQATSGASSSNVSEASLALGALKDQPNIVGAAVISAGDRPLASYVRPGASEKVFDAVPREAGVSCGSELCFAVHPVLIDHSLKEVVILVSDLSGLNTQLQENAKNLSLTFVCSIMIALIVASILQRFITKPLEQVVELTEKIAFNRDYSLRLPSGAVDERPNETGKLVRSVNHMLDQIEQRDVELLQAKEAAEQANRAKTMLVADTSHEIRTPINNIIGFTEIISRMASSPEEKRYLNLIQLSADSLLGIIDDILDISKMESGRLDLKPAPADISAHLKKVLRPLEAHAANLGLDLQVNIAEDCPKTIFIDAVRFSRVVVNLVSSAMKFTAVPGKIAVDIRSELDDTGSVILKVAVEDSGAGPLEQGRSEIFEAFRTAQKTKVRGFQGPGSGLLVSERIVGLMGSSLLLRHKIGEGARFSFDVRLPLSSSSLPVVQSSAATPSPAPSTESVERSPEKVLQVLVVEDNPMSREITVHRLKKMGFHVLVAGSGIDAVEIAGKDELDLILMDCQMPVMDGFEATAQIRKMEQRSGKRIPIVALTAHAVEGYRDICLSAGMDDYLTKPIHEADLVAFLTKHPRERKDGSSTDS